MNDDWVARLLADAERPAMPEDVAERLELGLRRQLAVDTGTTPSADPTPTAGPAPTGTTAGGVAPDGDLPEESPTGHPTTPTTGASATGPGGSAGSSVPTGPSTGPRVAAPVPAPSSGTRDDAPAAGAVPAPAVVPPTAGAGAGAAPLRAGADGDDPARTRDDPDGTEVSRSREGRTFGTPRREQRADDQGERRRRLLTRWVPVAAGVLVLGAAGAVTVNVLDGGSDSTADTAQEVAAADVADSVAPRSLVATGTEYTTADLPTFEQQVRDLVALAAAGTEGASASAQEDSSAGAGAAAADPSAPAPSSPAQADPAAARASAADNPLADAAALRECVETVTDGTDDDAAAVDLALVDGVESTVVVVPDPAGANLFVYVVGPDCTGVDSQFQFFTVAP